MHDNPMGTDGFEFVEYTAPDVSELGQLFAGLGFIETARHRSKNVVWYRQGDINFLVNGEPDSFSQAFAQEHGPSICAIGLRVKDAPEAHARALELGAEPHTGPVGPMELNIPAIKGIGGSVIYLVDRYGDRSIYDVDFRPVEARPDRSVVGLFEIDHLTHNVHAGQMDVWASFYERIFNFHEIRRFDIRGKQTGLVSRAMESPCGKIKIPINEPTEQASQIQEYLDAYRGEGIQHLALSCRDIYASVEQLCARGVRFLDTPDAYYEALDARLPGHGQPLERLRAQRILLDGAVTDEGPSLLLQIFTETVIGPIFFELIQRLGDEGFGEGNFQALFEAIERDQQERGVISA